MNGGGTFLPGDNVSVGAQCRTLYDGSKSIYVPMPDGTELSMPFFLEVGIMSVDFVSRGKISPYPGSCGAHKPCSGCLEDKRKDFLKPLLNGRKLKLRTLKQTAAGLRTRHMHTVCTHAHAHVHGRRYLESAPCNVEDGAGKDLHQSRSVSLVPSPSRQATLPSPSRHPPDTAQAD